MDAPLHPDTVARLRVPSLALDGCVYAYLWRDLSAAVDITEAQRTTWFPATPLCGMSWSLSGQVQELAPDGEPGGWLPAGLIGGPRSGPKRFRSTPGGRAFMVAVRPEAFQAMTGVDLGALKDRMLSLSEVVTDPDWQAFDRAMQAARDEHDAQRTFESFLLPRWRAARARMAAEAGGGVDGSATAAPRGYSGWMQHLAMRAVAAGHGRSVRQAERRIKQWSGQSLRALRLVSRAEAAFKSVRRHEESAEAVIWSALAHDNGYADQAHLCRETRRLSGFSPEELRRLVSESESFWAYRVWV
ncbi:helix-turn-helix domain-containing protein [Roseateles chitosanitabidus]|uniref:helix-turn-helix domain-containing protein n=1 Tax=Roseateles chitosanitabidus TaxID=65048 RepID=UPI00082F5891|nr:AraC family transcriptional regulator [Roseateles chitosanitabidus]MBO9687664.1 helix-turn-helix transcriptional regulator [Roseateles chitosanitabidus]